MPEQVNNELLSLTADIVAAHVANNSVATSDVSGLIASVHAALSSLSDPKPVEETEAVPAVPIRSSVKHDYIVCLEDGKKLKMLKRYLRTNYDMSPDDYRAKWKLPRDYPMVAPAYAEKRRGLARQIGLGRKSDDSVSDEATLFETGDLDLLAPAAKAKRARGHAALSPDPASSTDTSEAAKPATSRRSRKTKADIDA